jgi:hypothetical protein
MIVKESIQALALMGWSPRIALAVAAVGILLEAARRRFTSARTLAASAVHAFAMLTLGVMLHSVWIAASASPRVVSASHGAVPREAYTASAAPLKRVVWIVADELDERRAFSQRPPHLLLPALDRFREHAEYRNTLKFSTTIPSLLAGRPRATLAADGILRRVAQHRLRSAVVGWSLPYCHSVGATECASWPEARQSNSYEPHPVGNRFRSFLETDEFSPFGQTLAHIHHLDQMAQIEKAAVAAAANPNLSLVFLHLPQARPQGDLSALDSTFAHIRAGMEASGVWDNSTVLVTAAFEDPDRPAPFLLKSPLWVELDPAEPIDPHRTASILEELLLRPSPVF